MLSVEVRSANVARKGAQRNCRHTGSCVPTCWQMCRVWMVFFFLLGFSRTSYAQVACLIEPSGPLIKAVNSVLVSGDKALVGAENGLFLYRIHSRSDERLLSTVIDKINFLFDLGEDGILVGRDRGLFRYEVDSDFEGPPAETISSSSVDALARIEDGRES